MENKRTVLIAGGSEGIGYATAEKCLSQNCRVILIARGLPKLESARERLLGKGHSAEDVEIVSADLQKCEEIPALVGRLPWVAEGLWGLVLNAAIERIQPAVQFSCEEILATLRVNVVSPVLLISACYPAIRMASGNIVYVGSIADFKRDPGYSVYGGSKAFMKSFVGHAGQEMGPEGVRINVVSPGATDTEMMRRMRYEEKTWPEDQINAFEQSIPIEKRFARPDEIADAIWFALAGPRYFHGEDIRIYGGHR
jgi:NAD(P)-dependent dehydrogenase (short-subunit alcohol dehydrogenase family)